jgi:hypothetical protein
MVIIIMLLWKEVRRCYWLQLDVKGCPNIYDSFDKCGDVWCAADSFDACVAGTCSSWHVCRVLHYC